jgi:hypothetical protein
VVAAAQRHHLLREEVPILEHQQQPGVHSDGHVDEVLAALVVLRVGDPDREVVVDRRPDEDDGDELEQRGVRLERLPRADRLGRLPERGGEQVEARVEDVARGRQQVKPRLGPAGEGPRRHEDDDEELREREGVEDHAGRVGRCPRPDRYTKPHSAAKCRLLAGSFGPDGVVVLPSRGGWRVTRRPSPRARRKGPSAPRQRQGKRASGSWCRRSATTTRATLGCGRRATAARSSRKASPSRARPR